MQPISDHIEEQAKQFRSLDEPLRSKCRLIYLRRKMQMREEPGQTLRESYKEAREALEEQGVDPDEVRGDKFYTDEIPWD